MLLAWIDTAFTGELVVSHATILKLGLPRTAAILAGLADGTQVVLETYSCIIEWFGEQRPIEVVENEGQFPLLGVGLLRDHALSIDYRSGTLMIA